MHANETAFYRGVLAELQKTAVEAPAPVKPIHTTPAGTQYSFNPAKAGQPVSVENVQSYSYNQSYPGDPVAMGNPLKPKPPLADTTTTEAPAPATWQSRPALHDLSADAGDVNTAKSSIPWNSLNPWYDNHNEVTALQKSVAYNQLYNRGLPELALKAYKGQTPEEQAGLASTMQNPDAAPLVKHMIQQRTYNTATPTADGKIEFSPSKFDFGAFLSKNWKPIAGVAGGAGLMYLLSKMFGGNNNNQQQPQYPQFQPPQPQAPRFL